MNKKSLYKFLVCSIYQLADIQLYSFVRCADLETLFAEPTPPFAGASVALISIS